MNEIIVSIERNNKTDVFKVKYADGHIEYHSAMTESIRNFILYTTNKSYTLGDTNFYKLIGKD